MIRVEIDDRGLKALLNNILTKTGNLSPVMKVIGERIVRQTEERFNLEKGPDGKAWPAVKNPEQKTHPKILSSKQMRLRHSIHYLATGNRLEVGTANLPYAAIHQFGGKTAAHMIVPKNKPALFWGGAKNPVRSVMHPGSNIPARPYLGLSPENERDIAGIINAWIVKKGL